MHFTACTLYMYRKQHVNMAYCLFPKGTGRDTGPEGPTVP